MRLGLATLSAVRAARPGFDPASLGIGIVHLGCGAFHRAHQAAYTQAAIERSGDTSWGIAGASLQSPDVPGRLAPQDGLFTLIERGPEADRCRVIGALSRVLFAPGERAALLDLIAAPATRIVSLTVTEKGYCHAPATGRLDPAHPGIARDLADPAAAATAPGLLVAGLARRRALGGAPLSVLCCDNLPDNGATVRRIALDFAERVEPALARWIEREIAFPGTMVDRIVPQATAEDRAVAEAALGLADEAPVAAEPFTQWAIEDRFAAGRPAWDLAGAELVAAVKPYEDMKLRLLNASHSALAYLGYLLGAAHIAEAVRIPALAAFVDRLMGENAATLALPPGHDVEGYRRALFERWRNPRIRHRTWQIAMDGSQKLPQRLLAPARANLAAGRPVAMAALAVAAWMRYALGRDEAGGAIDVRDPLAADFARIAAAGGDGDGAALARGFLSLEPVFGRDLAQDARFAGPVTQWLQALLAGGAAKTLAALA
jgi:fructuronate reductase